MAGALVGAVVFMIVGGYVLWVLTVLLPWLRWWLTSPVGLLNLVYLQFEALMLIWSYFTAITTDPGTPPPNWRPLASEETLLRAKEDSLRARHPSPGAATPPMAATAGGAPVRFCSRCKIYKPPRTHHCRICQRCVLKMDHHCPWVNNCVGFYNHKPFVLFCFWAPWTISHYLIFFGIRFVELIFDATVSGWWIAAYIVMFCVYVPCILLIGSLLGWQLYLVAQNATTIEMTEKRHRRRHRRRRAPADEYRDAEHRGEEALPLTQRHSSADSDAASSSSSSSSGSNSPADRDATAEAVAVVADARSASVVDTPLVAVRAVDATVRRRSPTHANDDNNDDDAAAADDDDDNRRASSAAEQRSPYDLGLIGNAYEFFGSFPLLWLAPLPNPRAGNGTRFRTARVAETAAEQV